MGQEEKSQPPVEEEEEADGEDEEEDEFQVEDCYAYASGFKGKIAKKALFKAFGEYGKIVGVKQVAKKCRIQYTHPSAVEKLVKSTFQFNGKVLDISRTLGRPTSSKGGQKPSLKKWSNKSPKSSGDPDRGDTEEVEMGRGDSDDEGGSEEMEAEASKTRKKVIKAKK